MTIAKTREVVGGELDEREKEKERAGEPEVWGAALLSLFFTSSLFLGTNMTLRLYDPLGAIGYTALFVSAWVRSAEVVGPIFLVLYYVWGGLHKIGEQGFTNRAQLVGRLALAIYYAALVVRLAWYGLA